MLEQHLIQLLTSLGIPEPLQLSKPPKQDMGDYAFACFDIAKQTGKNPAEYAKELVEKIQEQHNPLITKVQAFGPYVNFFLNIEELALQLLADIHTQGNNYGKHSIGKGKTYLIEFGCPNPLKAFHLGHLKNLITGESVARLFEQGGYTVVRVNYQGDVGMHVAKALWGIVDWKEQFDVMAEMPLTQRVEFLGKAYAHGAAHYEKDDASKQEVVAYNDKVYEEDPSIQEIYTKARAWSLAYFDDIYTRMDTRFDHFYFESQTAMPGIALVKEYQTKQVFEEGEGGAIIFPGSRYGLHDRVFINGKGYPTYEAKEVALAQEHFKQQPDKIIHVVGKEQTEYFKVVIAAIEQVFPDKQGIEYHLPGGFLQLKGEEKMSSRKGNIITGDELIALVEEKIARLMREQEKDTVTQIDDSQVHTIAAAALKYAMLKADITKDIAFDMDESVSTSGDSGPYLLYTVARINSMLAKNTADTVAMPLVVPDSLHDEEKQLVFMLAEYPQTVNKALEHYDPSFVAKYLFSLAQAFHRFYAACPVLTSDPIEKRFRVALVESIQQTMTNGLHILGIKTVSSM